MLVTGCSSPSGITKTATVVETVTSDDAADAFMREARDISSIKEMSLNEISNLIFGICDGLRGADGPTTVDEVADSVYKGWDHWENRDEVLSFIRLSQKYYCPETL